MTSIWFPNNKYPPNTKNYLPCFVLGGGGGLVLGGRDYCGDSRSFLLLSSRTTLSNFGKPGNRKEFALAML